jgi:hypothetical protein
MHHEVIRAAIPINVLRFLRGYGKNEEPRVQRLRVDPSVKGVPVVSAFEDLFNLIIQSGLSSVKSKISSSSSDCWRISA